MLVFDLGERHNKDYRVLVVDSDPQANATSVLFPKEQDISSVPTLADVYDEREPFPITQVITQTSVSGLDLIPSSIGLFDVEPDLDPQALRIAMLDAAPSRTHRRRPQLRLGADRHTAKLGRVYAQQPIGQ